MTHICVIKLTVIGSDNGLSPERRQAIIWTNAGILLIGPLGTNLNEISIKIHTFSFKKMHLKMSSGKWRPFCLGLNVISNSSRPNHAHMRQHDHCLRCWLVACWCQGVIWTNAGLSLRWRHNERDSISNHQPYDCLLNGSFRRRSKKTSKLRVTGLCVGNSPGAVNSPHKWPVTRKMFPFGDVIISFIGHLETNSIEICIKMSRFSNKKWIWKCRLENVGRKHT